MMGRFHPIVLLTDFGTKDAYAASVKGVIFSLHPQATVIDLTHEVTPQQVKQAAFLLEACYRYFPKGSIFVSVVDPGVGSERQILAARTRHGVFLAPDNGLLTRVLEKEKGFELRIVTNRNFFLKEVSSTFHGRDCFAPTAAHLAKNPGRFSKLGPKISAFKRLSFPFPRREGSRLMGEILYFDHFGNAFTNIHRRDLPLTLPSPPEGERVGVRGRFSRLEVRVKGKTLGPIRRSYFEASKGAAVAVFSSTGLLEIAVNQGSAREKLKLQEGTVVELI